MTGQPTNLMISKFKHLKKKKNYQKTGFIKTIIIVDYYTRSGAREKGRGTIPIYIHADLIDSKWH